MHDPEAVGDERVGETGELVGERAAHVVVLARLAVVEADVLEHGDLPVLERLDGGVRALADGVGRERDLLPEQLTEALGNRLQRVRRVRRPVGPAEVRDHEDARAGVGELPDRGDAGPDPAVVGDPAATFWSVQRHVEVRPDEHPLAADHPDGSPPRSSRELMRQRLSPM